MKCGEWLIPFGGRPDSVDEIGFLWRHKSIYVMDNHRAAMWCWLQRVDPSRPHSLLHIDQHHDCASSRLERENCPPDLQRLTIGQYLKLDFPYDDGLGGRCRLFRWDNYLSVYLALYHESIKRLHMCTQGVDSKPEWCFARGDLWNIPEQIENWLDPKDGPWIFNLDLDYFFWRAIPTGEPGLMVSDEYLMASFEKIGRKIEDGTIAVTTFALTPQCGLTGGWRTVERLITFILQILGVDFELPS